MFADAVFTCTSSTTRFVGWSATWGIRIPASAICAALTGTSAKIYTGLITIHIAAEGVLITDAALTDAIDAPRFF